ncbi:octopamine receptor-like [Exaiptasia diaphana]|uniref:G-protein coupled receptors family 1 profile domain-containing protein n=1 Tax=Exaiptasia diaphana TaxID=2652724 RepID=A0A913XTH0_EXADI|nr:octopamine receptor-like [Exaiptasia diaphana]
MSQGGENLTTNKDEILDHRSQAEIILQAVFLAIIMFSSIFGNILILLAIYTNHRLREITSAFIANLACADLLLALIGMPFTLTSSITYRWVFGWHWCQINGMANSVFCIASMLSLAAVSMDRYIAIIKPLNYKLIMTPRTVTFMIVYVWVQSISCALLPIMGWSRYTFIMNESICTGDWGYSIPYTMFIFGACFFVPLLVMIYSYYHILRTAREHAKRISEPRVGQLSDLPLSTAVAVPAPQLQQSQEQIKKTKDQTLKELKYKSDAKAAKTLLIVVGSFLFCWLPHFIGMTCLLFPSCVWPDEFFATTTWLAMMNSGCNPIIYGVLNRRFRESFKRLMRCGRMQRRINAESCFYEHPSH